MRRALERCLNEFRFRNPPESDEINDFPEGFAHLPLVWRYHCQLDLFNSRVLAQNGEKRLTHSLKFVMHFANG